MKEKEQVEQCINPNHRVTIFFALRVVGKALVYLDDFSLRSPLWRETCRKVFRFYSAVRGFSSSTFLEGERRFPLNLLILVHMSPSSAG